MPTGKKRISLVCTTERSGVYQAGRYGKVPTGTNKFYSGSTTKGGVLVISESFISYLYNEGSLIVKYKGAVMFKKPFASRQEAMAFIQEKNNRLKVLKAVAQKVAGGSKK